MNHLDADHDAVGQPEYFVDHFDVVFDHYRHSFEGLEHIVLNDFEADGPPVNIHVVSPPDVPFRVLLTEGMSVQAMPTSVLNKRFLELSLLIPAEVHFRSEAHLEQHEQRWMVDMLRQLARFPHLHGIFLDSGHVVQAGHDEGITFGKNCGFNSAMLLPSTTLWEALTYFNSNHGDIRILSVLPLYPEELSFRLENGLPALMDKIQSCRVTELLDAGRLPVTNS
jgi:hypothetical protein